MVNNNYEREHIEKMFFSCLKNKKLISELWKSINTMKSSKLTLSIDESLRWKENLDNLVSRKDAVASDTNRMLKELIGIIPVYEMKIEITQGATMMKEKSFGNPDFISVELKYGESELSCLVYVGE